ncbi:hypothetical protein U27_00398 [Candidatus Vecturithrix granuli]|uniref:Uncharacterized protein n=1 Tax=Vecturithrix granuli TaxID=1499967 RepID=A0A081C7E6_VECG1|nr:hypothetical protein U27_00398 [Candidatus Vecturithrix granuli]
MVLLRPYIEQFNEAQQKLKHRWETTKTLWNDPVSREFEKNVMVPLGEQIRNTQRELDRMAQVIEQARRNVR